MERFNDWLGLKITKVTGTMWAAYVFAALAIVSLPSVLRTHNLVQIVAWVAQTFLQLVLLPIIIVGQNIMGSAGEKRSQETHDATIAMHEAMMDELMLWRKIIAKIDPDDVASLDDVKNSNA